MENIKEDISSELNLESEELLRSVQSQMGVLEEILFPAINDAEMNLINFYGRPRTGKSKLAKIGVLKHNWVLHDPRDLLFKNSPVRFDINEFKESLSKTRVNVFDEARYIENFNAIFDLIKDIGAKVIVITQPPIAPDEVAKFVIDKWMRVEFVGQNQCPIYEIFDADKGGS